MGTKAKLIIFLWVVVICSIKAQEVKCPPIWGIAKITFLTSSMDAAREYYGRFLGFGEVFSYPSSIGAVVSFKVSDRQFLEFVVDKNAKDKNRLVAVSLETENVEQMRLYLKSKGVKVPDKLSIDGAGNEVILVSDNDGNPIEFIHYMADGLHRKSKGKLLLDTRISTRIHHVGIYTKQIDEQDPFWVKILQCHELIRYPEDRAYLPVIQYLDFGNSTESIEHYSPNGIDITHPCLLVDDMQETIYTLKERRGEQTLERPTVGKGHRWILNLKDSDMTKTEFTEAYRVR